MHGGGEEDEKKGEAHTYTEEERRKDREYARVGEWESGRGVESSADVQEGRDKETRKQREQKAGETSSQKKG